MNKIVEWFVKNSCMIGVISAIVGGTATGVGALSAIGCSVNKSAEVTQKSMDKLSEEIKNDLNQ